MAMRLLNVVLALGLMSAAFGLGGCANMVISQTPVFTPDESVQAPKLKPGFWSFDMCADPRSAGRQMCDGGFIVSEKTVDFAGEPPGGPGVAARAGDLVRPFPYRLGVGEPLLMQVELGLVRPSEMSDAGGAAYMFVALDPKSRDDQGRIDRAEIWIVKCGPRGEPKPEEMGEPRTDHPFPGVLLTEHGCQPTGKTSLFSVARASRAISGGGPLRGVYRWISDRAPEQAASSSN